MKKTAKILLFWLAAAVLWEVTFHLSVWRGFTPKMVYAAPFSQSLAVFFTGLTVFWRRKRVNLAVAYVLLAAMAFVYSVQTVYYYIFKSLLSLMFVSEGGKAITGFFDVMMDGIFHCLPYILIYLLPIPALALFSRRGALDFDRGGAYGGAVLLSASVLIFALGVPSESSDSAWAREYYDRTASISDQAESFGLITAERLEAGRMLSDSTGLKIGTMDLTKGESRGERNVVPGMNFRALAESTEDIQDRELSEYFYGLEGTAKNDFTGMFEGYNLIEICAESYWPYMVDPERTPALYRLTHEGIVFDNFYCSFFNTTTNGEYCLCMGLMPDFNRMSFNVSTANFLPQTLAHAYLKEGIQPLAYHNFTGYYYGRAFTHPNMGFTFKAPDFGLELTQMYHPSDLELFQLTVDEYIDQERFFAYYMTFSGHVPYTHEDNVLVDKNFQTVEDLDYTDPIKCYLASEQELELGLEYLLDRLEEKGIADRTLIVLTGDHYPYGLSSENLKLLAGDRHSDDPYWLQRNSFVCWTGGMEEPIHVESPCCTQDILPTVLNLLGMEYDSRLLTGRDVLSDCTHAAVLQDGSFITEDLRYDASTDSFTFLTPESQLPRGYARDLQESVENLFSVSAAVLRSNYYAYAYWTLDLEEVERPALYGSVFFDTQDRWYNEQVNDLAKKGVVTPNGILFRGDDEASVAELAVMVARGMKLPVPESEECPFTNLEKDGWQYNDMMALWAAGVLTDPDVDPAKPVSMEDACTYARRLAQYYGLDPETFIPYLSYAAQKSVDEGREYDPLTRGMAAYFADEVMKLMESIL